VVALRPKLVELRLGCGGAFTCDAAVGAEDGGLCNIDNHDSESYVPRKRRRYPRGSEAELRRAQQSDARRKKKSEIGVAAATAVPAEPYDLERLEVRFYTALPEAKTADEAAKILAKWPRLVEAEVRRQTQAPYDLVWSRALATHLSRPHLATATNE
jgi:hypothetical protein